MNQTQKVIFRVCVGQAHWLGRSRKLNALVQLVPRRPTASSWEEDADPGTEGNGDKLAEPSPQMVVRMHFFTDSGG